MAAFDYILQVEGDCQNLGLGEISISLVGGTPPYTVEWVSPDLGTDILTTNPSVRYYLDSGNYAVRVNDSTLPINQEFYINIPVSSGVCASVVSVRNSYCGSSNGSVTGSSTSDYSSTKFYLYTNNDVLVTSATTNTSTIVFNSLSPGIYYLVAEDLGGCNGVSPDFIIEDSNDFDFGLYVVPNSSCGGTPIGKIYVTGITGSAPYSYLWNNGAITDSISGLSAGNYSVSVTDSNGCTLTKSASVVNVDPVGFGAFTSVSPTCLSNDGSLTLTITGGTAPFYYSASTGYVEINYLRTFTLSDLGPGNYSIQVTDAGLCSFVASSSLNSPDGFTSVDISTTNSICSSNDGSIIINVEGGVSPYTYVIIGPGGNTQTITSTQTSQTFSDLSSGEYTVIASTTIIAGDPSSTCSYSEEVTLISQNKFTVTTSITGTTCGNDNGYVQINASSGGTLPYTYSLDGVNSLNGFYSGLKSGPHIVSVTDSTGCVQESNINVDSSTRLDFSLYSTSCGTGNSGTITAFIGLGQPPFSFTWSNNVSGNPQQITVSGLTAGTYSLTVVDSAGCSQSRSTSIDCISNTVSYQSYVMCSEIFSVQSPTKLGLLQMLNEGFYDLTSGNTGCNLISATYKVKVLVNPLGYSAETPISFTSTTLNQAPSDNLYYDAAQNVLSGIPGIGTITIDQLSNEIKIQTAPGDNSLNGQEIILDLIIVYDIMCST
jgi:uncharacterized protein (DUF2141 family)